MEKTKVCIMHSSHLDLYWIGAQADCLHKGAAIIDDALRRAEREPDFHFLIETARFLEYFAHTCPQRMDALRAAFARGQFEMAACYTDRLENHVGGESLVRNALYGKKIIRQLLGTDCRVACHPDLPGFAEQTPQIYRKAGIDYYLSARGFRWGARFFWQGLDGSDIIMYNIPGHYAYYDLDEVVAHLEETKQRIASDLILIGCSAGDMGPAGTFIAKEGGKGVRYDIAQLVEKLKAEHPACDFALAGAYATLEKMGGADLAHLRGEYPSRWGHHGSAMNVAFWELDKRVESRLTDAEKLTALCTALGMPPTLAFDRHPLKDPGGNGGSRRYFDLEFQPQTVADWLEYAWRLQIITQDHNFGGVEGAQTEFDRLIYKKAALKIADALITTCDDALAARAGCGRDGFAVINTLNWTRNAIVPLPEMGLEAGRAYEAVDEGGARLPVVCHQGAWYALAQGVPSVGVKTFRVQPGAAPVAQRFAVEEADDCLTVSSAHYRVVISKRTGCLAQLVDLNNGRDWAAGDALDVVALRDDSLGGSERSAVKEELDRGANHVCSVRLTACNALFAEVTVVCEVMDVKVYKTLRIPAHGKQVEVSVRMNWPGTPDVQLKMNLCGRSQDSRIVYGVPYGAQEYGAYLETESLKFGSDEISAELFHRYREVQGFFAVEQEGAYLMAATSQSAMDFVPGGAQVVLLRDVRNGAEQDYRFTNYGPRSYHFVLRSGEGGWEQAARLTWEMQQPMHPRALEGERAQTRLGQTSYLATGGEGVLTVLAAQQSGGLTARLYNPTGTACSLAWTAFGQSVQPRPVNLDGTPSADAPGLLKGYEIKTVTLDPAKEV